MDYKTFEALVFPALFESNNKIRIQQGVKPLSFEGGNTFYGYLSHKVLMKSFQVHTKDLYERLKPYLED